MIYSTLSRCLKSKNGFLRKGSALALQMPKRIARCVVEESSYQETPPVLANSFPKSGTHLLDQVVEGLPGRRNFGAFLASMTSSFRFRERTDSSVFRFIAASVPGEVIRGHLFYRDEFSEWLKTKNVVHYFIIRDPRDVVVSEAHYLRVMNRWHRLHRFFRQVDNLEEAIDLSIRGLNPRVLGIDYPNIAERFERYAGWLSDQSCMVIRYEDLSGPNRLHTVRKMAEFYQGRTTSELALEECVERMVAAIVPKKSHTYREGGRGGWQKAFTERNRQSFEDVAGDLLISLGYESDHSWLAQPLTTH